MVKNSTKSLPIILLMFLSVSLFGQKIKPMKSFGQKIDLLQGSIRHEHVNYEGRESIICYASDQDMPIVPMSDELRAKTNARSKEGAQFIIDYNGFNDEQKDAFEFALSFWSASFQSNIPIRVKATFLEFEDEEGQPLDDVLGRTFSTLAVRDFRNAPFRGSWYQYPLAEKIADQELNSPNEPDIEIEFNTLFSWYYDFENPEDIGETGLSDFATVALHEIGHALAFSALATVTDQGNGLFSIGGFPFAFNQYVETQTGVKLFLEIDDNSLEMAQALTGDNLRFASTTTTQPIYAPSPYDPGSSTSHLDQIGQELMNPQLGPNGFIHKIGLAENMLKDMGWEFTYLTHDQIGNNEEIDSTFQIVANVRSDIGFDTASLVMRYSYDEFETDSTEVNMVWTGDSTAWVAELPPAPEEGVIAYYLEVEDINPIRARQFRNPGVALGGGRSYFGFVAAIDDSIPTIEHFPDISFVLETEDRITLNATVFDDQMGVDTVYIEWFVNDVQQESVGMRAQRDIIFGYFANINLPTLTSGDVISYRVVAVDRAKSMNTGLSPVEGRHEILVEAVPEPLNGYSNNFDEETNDFAGNLFTVETPVSFVSGALHSEHPYLEANPQADIDFVTQLRNPIIIAENDAIIQFDEIVLIEPGEPGTVFGGAQFWDYVIVEGSKNNGQTWIPFLDGYDCREDQSWFSKYTNSVNSDLISTASGNPSDYRTRTIDMLESGQFDAGDEILIRFRLFSDQLAAGWGWAIDNLNIQQNITAISDYLDSESDYRVFPNPTSSGRIQIEGRFKKAIPSARLFVTDVMGRIVTTASIPVEGQNLEYQLDIGDQPAGVYFVKTMLGQDQITRKIIKSQ